MAYLIKNESSIYDSLFIQIKKIKTPRYKTALSQMLEIAYTIKNGDDVVDFEMQDVSDNRIRLSHFKGKVIYIDVWATWCGPCLKEMPFLDSLKTHFKEQNIVFIKLSIDEDKMKWRKYEKTTNTSEYSYISNRGSLDKYKLIGLPRYIVIDQNFKIAELFAESPSDEALSEKLMDYLLE